MSLMTSGSERPYDLGPEIVVVVEDFKPSVLFFFSTAFNRAIHGLDGVLPS